MGGPGEGRGRPVAAKSRAGCGARARGGDQRPRRPVRRCSARRTVARPVCPVPVGPQRGARRGCRSGSRAAGQGRWKWVSRAVPGEMPVASGMPAAASVRALGVHGPRSRQVWQRRSAGTAAPKASWARSQSAAQPGSCATPCRRCGRHARGDCRRRRRCAEVGGGRGVGSVWLRAP